MLLATSKWQDGVLLQNGLYAPYSLCAKPYDAQVSTDFIREPNTKSVRFELRANDPVCGGSKRAELYIMRTNAVAMKSEWYAFSIYVPADYAKDAKAEGHFQIHQAGSSGSPLVEFWAQNDLYYLALNYDNNGDGVYNHPLLPIGAIDKGKWTDWVLRYKYSVGNDGIIELWKNGEKITFTLPNGTKTQTIAGPNYNLVNGVPEISPYPKFGIYKWPWSAAGTYNPSVRVLYHAMVMFGDKDCTFADFAYPAPAETTTTIKPRNRI